MKRPPPFPFETLKLPNDCFIEAVRFHDAYFAAAPEGKDRWLQLFQFGSKIDDATTGTGHSVAIFQWKGRLDYFDTNQGIVALPVPPKQRNDMGKIAPLIYARYPHLQPVMPMLLCDVWQLKRPGLKGETEAVETEACRQALRVAQDLARVRETRVVRFSYLKDGQRRETAAAVFVFEGRLCLYVPDVGTILGAAPLASVNDLGLIRHKLARSFGPDAKLELILPAKK